MTSLPDRLVVSLEVAFLDTDTTTVFGNAADGYLLPWPSLYDNQHILCYTKGPIPVMLYGDVRMGQKHFDRCVCEDQDEIMKLVGNSGVKCAAPFSTTNSNGLGASNASQMHYFVVSYENGQVLIFSFGRGQDKEKYVLQLVAHTQSNQDIDNIYPQPNVWQYDTVIDIMQHIWLYSQATNELSLLTFKHNTIDAKVTVQFNTSQGDQTDGDFGELHDVENINTALGYNALTAFHFKRQLVGGATITSFVVDARLVLHFAEKAWKGPNTIRLPGLPDCLQLGDVQEQVVSLQVDTASIADLCLASYSVSSEECFPHPLYSYKVRITVSDGNGNNILLDIPAEQMSMNSTPHTVLDHVVSMGSHAFSHPTMPLGIHNTNGALATDMNLLMEHYGMSALNLMPLLEDRTKSDHNDFSSAREVLLDTAIRVGLGSLIANYIIAQEGEEVMLSGSSSDNYVLQDVKRVTHWAINSVKTRLERSFLDVLQKRILPYLINKIPTALLYTEFMNGDKPTKVGNMNAKKGYASMSGIQGNAEETVISLVESLNDFLVICDSLCLVIEALHERKSAQSHINDNDQDAKQEHFDVLDNLFLKSMELKYLSQLLKILMELVCCPGFSFSCLTDGSLQKMYSDQAVQFKGVEKILPSLLMTSEGNTGPVPLTLFDELVMRLYPDAQSSAYLTDDGTSRRHTPSSKKEIIDTLISFFLLPKENLSLQVHHGKVEREAWVDMLDVGMSVMLHGIMDVFHLCYTDMSTSGNTNEMDEEEDGTNSSEVVIEGYTHRLQSFFNRLSIASDLVPSLRDALLNLWCVDASFIMGRTIPSLARSQIVLNDPRMIQAVIRRLLFTNKVEACRDLLFNTSNTNAIRTVFGCCAMAAAIPNVESWKAIWSTAKRHTRNLSRENAKEAKVGIIYIMIRWCWSNKLLASFLESNFDNDEECEVERFLANYVSEALAKDHTQYVDGTHLYISWLLHRQKYDKAKEVHQSALDDARKGMNLGNDVSSKLLQEFSSMAM